MKNNNIYENDWINSGIIPEYFEKQEKKKKYIFYLKIFSIFLLICTLSLVAMNSSKQKNTTIVTDTGEKIEKQIKLNNGYVKKENKDKKYDVYVDEKYNFYCAIPNEYKISDSVDNVNRVVLSNKDSSILIFIGASENKFDLKIDDLMEQYVSTLGNKVDYKAHGDNWYAISKNYKGVSYYKKSFIKEGLILWFEFNIKDESIKTPEDKKVIADTIEYIEDNFNILKK